MADYDLGTYGAEIVINDSQFTQGLNNAEQSIQNTDNKAKGFAKNLGAVAVGAVAGLGVALAGATVAGVKMADEMDKALNGLQASTGATEDEMKGMEDSLKNIYNANFGESFDDIAQSMATVKQNTGLAGQALEDATTNALMLRDTFDMDVTESTNAANSMMKQFGISSEEAFNLIAQGAQNGANKNGDLIDSLNEYAPQFKALGFSAEEFTNVLIDGAENGAFSIDKVGDAMKEFNIRSKDGSKTSVEAFKALGLNAEEMTNAFAHGGETAQTAFKQVMNSLNSIEDPIAKNAAGVALFGTQFEDLEAEGIAAFANIGNTASLSKDALGQINEVKYDTFGEAVQGIGRNLNTGLLLPLGEMVLPLLNSFANWIMEKMPIIQGVFETVFNSINSIASTVYSFFQENILPIFSKWFDNVQANFPIIKQTAQTVFDAILKVGNTLWTFFKDNILPIFTSFYQWIEGHMPTIRKTVETVFNKITEVAKVVWGFFNDNILPVFERLFSWVQSKIPTIQSIFEKAFGIIKNVVEVVWDIFENILLPVLKTLWDWVSPYIPKIQKIIETAFDAIFWAVDKVIGVFEDVSGAIEKAIDWLTFWDKKEPKDKNINVNTNYTSSGNRSKTGDFPAYAVGTPFVPNDQLALVHKGEAIIPAKYNPFNSNNRMKAENTTNNKQPITMDNSITFNVYGEMTNNDMNNAANHMLKQINRGMAQMGLTRSIK